MRKSLFLCSIILLYIGFSQSVSYGFAVNIRPSILDVSVKPGGSTSGTIVVYNGGDDDVGIKVYAQDWLYNPDGSKSFYAAGTTPLSCAKWIYIFPQKFNLEAKSEIGVQYTINLPENAEGGYHAIMFFESISGETFKKDFGERVGMSVQVTGRLGAIVFLHTEGKSICRGAIESLSVSPPQSDKPLEMSLSFKNTGNVHISAEGMLNIVDEKGNVYGKKKFGPLNTLPGDTVEKKVEWYGGLDEGSYYAVVTLDVGDVEPIVGEAKLDIFFGGAIEKLSVDVSKGIPSFSVSVKNTGHLNIETVGRVDVFSKDGVLVKSLSLKKSLIAPGKEKELKDTLGESLPPGTYTAKAIVSIGTKELVKEEVFYIE